MTRTTKKRASDVHRMNAKLVISQGPMRSPRWVKDHPALVDDVTLALRAVEHRTLLAVAKRLRKDASTLASEYGACLFRSAAEQFEADAKRLEKK